ncbi:5,6-dihydroxyindole-2-carboxylic acid oxidase-like [Scyliorhinus torazame]|uniref:5,6-dihydroxyindole-2-carboxylic acid oxidase-like n=1 Tax=Scyliorhinus torazame TaxID=75743 RepID=UPI003B5C15BB
MSPREQGTFIQRLDLSKKTLSNRFVIYASERASPRSRKSFRRVSVYDTASYMHYLCAKSIGGRGIVDYAHRSPLFLVWHRMWHIHLEQEIRNITGDDSFSIPFWSWVGKSHCDVCTDDLFGRNEGGGQIMPNSIFSSWRTQCTNDREYVDSMDVVCAPGCGQLIYRLNGAGLEFRPPLFNGLPTKQDYDACFRLSVFDRPPYNENATFCFRNALEGFIDPKSPCQRGFSMHIAVHVFLGGTQRLPSESANDPLFPSIHVNVDK